MSVCAIINPIGCAHLAVAIECVLRGRVYKQPTRSQHAADFIVVLFKSPVNAWHGMCRGKQILQTILNCWSQHGKCHFRQVDLNIKWKLEAI